jgi:meso-butanediol dehydrogenase/(S,S)-butanediol dehydrogenase/diacetyl reductase
MARFTGKVVLISGTGSRQGRVAAMAFANEGAKVLGCDINIERSAETTRLVLEAGGDMISIEPVDLANPANAKRWVDIAASRWGKSTSFIIMWQGSASRPSMMQPKTIGTTQYAVS